MRTPEQQRYNRMIETRYLHRLRNLFDEQTEILEPNVSKNIPRLTINNRLQFRISREQPNTNKLPITYGLDWREQLLILLGEIQTFILGDIQD